MAKNDDPKREQRTKAEKRRHHYTPVLYLRNFTDARGALHAIYLPAGNRAQTAPEALGFERDLYRPHFEELDPNVYEDIFGEFEGEAAPVIREISETRTQVATLNGRTISGAQRFVATCSDDFIVEGPSGILTADEYIAVVKADAEASRISTT